MSKVLEMKKDDRPRRGVVLALEQHFAKYSPDVVEDLDYVSSFNEQNDSLLDDGPEAA